jgi:hypothetical protein
MRKIVAFISVLFGVALLSVAVYLTVESAVPRSIGSILGLLGAILIGILSAGTGIKDWLELLKNSKGEKPKKIIEISGDSPQISTGENSRNIQTEGGDYIEKLEISLSIQDNSFKQQVASRKPAVRRTENVTPFLIGVVLDLSKTAFDSIYQLSQKDDDFFQRLIKVLNTLVNKSISYCEHPHSKDILPKFSLFFYGFGFGNALRGLDSMVRRLGITSDVEIPTEPVRDLLKLAADSDELPYTPNAAELNKYWKTYRSGILAQYFDMEFNDAPLIKSLKIAHERFANEQKDKKYQPLLLVITNGKFTDGDYLELIATADAIKDDGITLVIGYIGKNDIMPPRTLYSKQSSKWNHEAKTLFQCSSQLDRSGKIGNAVSDIAIEKSWEVPDNAKLFVQVNHQEMLEELIDIVTSPLRD